MQVEDQNENSTSVIYKTYAIKFEQSFYKVVWAELIVENHT